MTPILQIAFLFLVLWFKIAYSTILDYGVSTSDQENIVYIHNEYRKLVANGTLSGQPRGINLLKVEYDATLAAAAQEIANTTVFAHVSVSDDRFYVGQNLYMLYSTAAGATPNWASALRTWFNEHSSYTYSACCTGVAGHYTQMVWAETYYVGCGFTYFNASGTYTYRKFYVCNYGPGGNIVGEYPYETGVSGCEDLC